MISSQLRGFKRPSCKTSKPCGVCIQLLAAIIQNAEISVPIATMQVAAKCILALTRFNPKSIIPKKEASRKKAVSTSKPKSGPKTLAVLSEKIDQFVQN